jgi:protein-tyrosine phosphatase
MTQIEPNLFLGDYRTLQDPTYLTTNAIGVIIDLIQYYPGLEPIPITPPVRRYYFPMADRVDQDPFVYFDTIREILDRELPTTRVYVHCEQGISRAPTIVAAYLMTQYGWSMAQAIEFLRSKRPQVNPNSGFRKYLAAHEALLKEES